MCACLHQISLIQDSSSWTSRFSLHSSIYVYLRHQRALISDTASIILSTHPHFTLTLHMLVTPIGDEYCVRVLYLVCFFHPADLTLYFTVNHIPIGYGFGHLHGKLNNCRMFRVSSLYPCVCVRSVVQFELV